MKVRFAAELCTASAFEQRVQYGGDEIMKRTKDLVGMAVACTLAVPALLTGCTHSDPVSTAATANTRSSVDEPAVTVASDGLPEIIVTASRSRNIVISERDSTSVSN
jgi:malate/lactate dehydrogenase